MAAALCLPPGILAGPEVGLHPRDEEDLAVVDVGVNQGQRLQEQQWRYGFSSFEMGGWGNRGVRSSYQRSRPTDDLALVVVLGSVAGAEELVLGGVPRHDASQVGADGVDTVGG
jgi:hypothetical protein